MEKLFKYLIILFVVVVSGAVILQLTVGKKEKFSGGGGHGGGSRGTGSGSYQNSYSGINADDYSEGYRNSRNGRFNRTFNNGTSKRRTYGNSYMDYPIDGYWNYQTSDERFRGCLNLFMLNCGTSESCYDEGVALCINA
jgi:hypothetical protein